MKQEIDQKSLRKISYLIKCLLTPSRIIMSAIITENNDFMDYLSREIRLPNGRHATLTHTGLKDLRELIKTIYELDLFSGLADYDDIGSSLRSVYGKLLVAGDASLTANDLINFVYEEVSKRISSYRLAVPISGLIFESLDRLELGSAWLVNDLYSTLGESGETPVSRHVGSALKAVGSAVWLVGSIEGTLNVARARFSYLVDLLLGLLAVYGAVTYKDGAMNFRLCAQMSAETTSSRGTCLHWQLDHPGITVNYQYQQRQHLRMDTEDANRIQTESLFGKGFVLIEKGGNSQLEKTVIRALRWFSDAQRDISLTMQFVKYWSCVEAFFSGTEKVVRSVSTGLAITLVAGGFEVYSPEEYFNLKSRIAKLYAARCKAVHHGYDEHISWMDVRDLSEWCAWLIVTMLSLVERSYTSTSEIKRHIDRLDAVLIRGNEKAVLGARPES
ncbi:hypothetical protein LN458_06885 [Xanthomonas arboricola]|uniref:HEPN domain-containing protein n=1 Tax=Xanthomonas arboricola TaxID=56448 RepID=UPI001E2D3861|nr:HEPN domain-containing protein [Xanthomonas arboricola]MCC8473717.1 hypothetical protein [Xanthomonas arboricola]